MTSALLSGLIAFGVGSAIATASPPAVRVERSHDRIVLRTPFGSFVTYAEDLPPELLDAATGGHETAVQAFDASMTIER